MRYYVAHSVAVIFVISGKKYGGSYIDFVYVSDATNEIVSHVAYIFSSSYPSWTTLNYHKCQVSNFQLIV